MHRGVVHTVFFAFLSIKAAFFDSQFRFLNSILRFLTISVDAVKQYLYSAGYIQSFLL